MEIIAFSDTHGVHVLPIVDSCDVVVVAGDISPLHIQRDIKRATQWFTNDFLQWTRQVDCKKVLFVGGNHDFFLESLGLPGVNGIIKKEKLEDKVVYLQDSIYEFQGVTFYGTPCCEGPRGWAFVPIDTQVFYERIPKCDILITHQPPRVEKVGCSHPNTPLEREFGSEKLRLNMINKDIKVNICGHVHTGAHDGVQDGYYDRMIYNVSLLDEQYKMAYPLTTIDLQV